MSVNVQKLYKTELGGIIVPPKNSKILAKSIHYLLKNKKESVEMGKKLKKSY